MDVSVGQGNVVGRSGFYYYELEVAETAGAGHFCITHICVLFNGGEGSPESPLHAFLAAGEVLVLRKREFTLLYSLRNNTLKFKQ